MDAGFDRLQQRGLMTADEQMTDAGRAFREEIEVRTDELERPLLDAIGDDLDELWGTSTHSPEAIIDAGSPTLSASPECATSAADHTSAPG
jgi:hypothetical protein